MKPEAQRIAIAETCGFKPNGTGLWFKNARAYGAVEEPEDAECCGGIGGNYLPAIPDYLNDLNATDKMEEHLHGEEWTNYFDAIRTWGRASGVRATAPQRCEQFLRAKGKWVEDKQ